MRHVDYSHSPLRAKLLKESQPNFDIKRQMDDMNLIIEANGKQGAIWLGNLEAARNLSLLKHHQIGAVLSLCNQDISTQVKQYLRMHKKFYAEDVETFDISQHFEAAFSFIDQARQVTNILIHCYAGISRSTTILIAYMMRKQGLSVRNAMREVRARRWQIYPNEGFVQQLQDYEIQLQMSKRQQIDTARTNLSKQASLERLDEHQPVYKDLNTYDKLENKPNYISQTHRLIDELKDLRQQISLKNQKISSQPIQDDQRFYQGRVSKYPTLHQKKNEDFADIWTSNGNHQNKNQEILNQQQRIFLNDSDKFIQHHQNKLQQDQMQGHYYVGKGNVKQGLKVEQNHHTKLNKTTDNFLDRYQESSNSVGKKHPYLPQSDYLQLRQKYVRDASVTSPRTSDTLQNDIRESLAKTVLLKKQYNLVPQPPQYVTIDRPNTSFGPYQPSNTVESWNQQKVFRAGTALSKTSDQFYSREKLSQPELSYELYRKDKMGYPQKYPANIQRPLFSSSYFPHQIYDFY